MFERFTETLLNDCDYFRYFCFYYRYEDMVRPAILAIDYKRGINTDPNRRIVPKEQIGMPPARARFRKMKPWMTLFGDIMKADPSLSILIVDWKALDKTKVLAAVGRNGRWVVHPAYMEAFCRIIVGFDSIAEVGRLSA